MLTPEQIAHFETSPYAFEPDAALLNSDSPRLRNMVEGLVELGEKARSLEV